jgi:hypothetical protein
MDNIANYLKLLEEFKDKEQENFIKIVKDRHTQKLKESIIKFEESIRRVLDDYYPEMLKNDLLFDEELVKANKFPAALPMSIVFEQVTSVTMHLCVRALILQWINEKVKALETLENLKMFKD